jgi:dethiobiotin synthetase/adenosylmethionine--8-amino-7-oxononanoate aminotransferase
MMRLIAYSYVQRYSGHQVSTLFKFDDAVSPHVAARKAARIPTDEHINHILSKRLQEDANAIAAQQEAMGIALIETAGGVLSPGPSGTPQADLFRPMRLPTVLVGGHRLGGIAATISAAESLIIRGYDIDAVVCFDDQSKYENAEYLEQYFRNMSIPAFTLPWIPDLAGVRLGSKDEQDLMQDYYTSRSQGEHTSHVAGCIIDRHAKRIEGLESMAPRTKEAIWHPFTQHKHVTNADDVLVFDSAYGDYFQVRDTTPSTEKPSVLFPAFDGSASWWTQGLGHGNPRLALEAAYAAGRYGHVMFAGATHQPALILAEKMLKNLENPRLKKVFYTDNGSTATEVGIKMGLRTACKRYDWYSANDDVGIIGLKGSYHGDTIGAMDASEPCVFNEKVDWYRGRGYWFDYPTYKLRDGKWVVEPPAGMEEDFGTTQEFESQDDIFDLGSRAPLSRYEAYIEKTLDELVKEQGKKFGALIMEPVILGAGGMIFVDPLFQQSLVRVVRRYNFSPSSPNATPSQSDGHVWSGLPVVFDEVFTGLNRLGRFSSGSFLGVHPDISVHAKLLTGGLLPLAITTASHSIFDAFWGDGKSEALLHGHSYTAHAVGCHIANTSLDAVETIRRDGGWESFVEQWNTPDQVRKETREATGATNSGNLWSMWSKDFVYKVSKHGRVDFVNALGSVLAVSLIDNSGLGTKRSFILAILELTRRRIHLFCFCRSTGRAAPQSLEIISPGTLAHPGQRHLSDGEHDS